MAAENVASLRPATRGHNLVVKVLEAKAVAGRGRGGKSEGSKLAECLVGDHSGCVILTVRNEQVDLAQPGVYLELKNAKVDMYRGSMKLILDKQSSVEVTKGQTFEPRKDFNMSLVEYEFVPFDAMA